MLYVLIIGVNCGLGLEYCWQLFECGWMILVVVCDLFVVSEFKVLDFGEGCFNLYVYDVSDVLAVVKLVEQVIGLIDFLFVNVGMMFCEICNFGIVGSEYFISEMCVNVFVFLVLVEVFVDQVVQLEMKVIVLQFSCMGLISDNDSGGVYGYCVFKVVFNVIGKFLSFDLQDCGIVMLVLYLGWVCIDMGGFGGLLMVEELVFGQFDLIVCVYDNLVMNGCFFYVSGEDLSWQGDVFR